MLFSQFSQKTLFPFGFLKNAETSLARRLQWKKSRAIRRANNKKYTHRDLLHRRGKDGKQCSVDEEAKSKKNIYVMSMCCCCEAMHIRFRVCMLREFEKNFMLVMLRDSASSSFSSSMFSIVVGQSNNNNPKIKKFVKAKKKKIKNLKENMRKV